MMIARNMEERNRALIYQRSRAAQKVVSYRGVRKEEREGVSVSPCAENELGDQ